MIDPSSFSAPHVDEEFGEALGESRLADLADRMSSREYAIPGSEELAEAVLRRLSEPAPGPPDLWSP